MKNPRSCSQAELFSMINQVSFAVNDMTLYLDTHRTTTMLWLIFVKIQRSGKSF